MQCNCTVILIIQLCKKVHYAQDKLTMCIMYILGNNSTEVILGFLVVPGKYTYGHCMLTQ